MKEKGRQRRGAWRAAALKIMVRIKLLKNQVAKKELEVQSTAEVLLSGVLDYGTPGRY